jgi:hypothetical protein
MMVQRKPTANGISPLPCYGGPWDGREAVVLRGSRFFWFVRTPEPRLVANQDTLDYTQVSEAEGVYVRQTKQDGRAGKEILYYRPVPGRIPA